MVTYNHGDVIPDGVDRADLFASSLQCLPERSEAVVLLFQVHQAGLPELELSASDYEIELSDLI